MLLSVYISWAPPSDTPLGRTPYFSPTFEFNNPLQFSLQFVALALALITAPPAAPVDLGARPTFMPGPIVPDESYTGYNPFKAAVSTTASDNEGIGTTLMPTTVKRSSLDLFPTVSQ